MTSADDRRVDGGREGFDLARVQALSFDCYGTLIDWETGILAVIRPWAAEAGIDVDDEALLVAFADSEAAAECELPTLRYPGILAESFRRVGALVGADVSDEWAGRLGGSVGDWPAFDDSAEALAVLAAHYTLIIVSNVHREGFAASNRQLHGRFAAVITAEDVGAYKPAEPHFDALDRTLVELGIEPDASLHVAQSLFHDHAPARVRGMRSVWINRRGGRIGSGAAPGRPDEHADEDEYAYEAEFGSMREFASAAQAAFAGSR